MSMHFVVKEPKPHFNVTYAAVSDITRQRITVVSQANEKSRIWALVLMCGSSGILLRNLSKRSSKLVSKRSTRGALALARITTPVHTRALLESLHILRVTLKQVVLLHIPKCPTPISQTMTTLRRSKQTS